MAELSCRPFFWLFHSMYSCLIKVTLYSNVDSIFMIDKVWCGMLRHLLIAYIIRYLLDRRWLDEGDTSNVEYLEIFFVCVTQEFDLSDHERGEEISHSTTKIWLEIVTLVSFFFGKYNGVYWIVRMHWTWCIPNPFSVETNRTAQDAQNQMLNPFSALFGKWGTKRQSRDRAIQIRKDDQVVARQTVPN